MIAYLLDIMKNTKKPLNGVVNTNFWGDKTCIVSINIVSVMKIEKRMIK